MYKFITIAFLTILSSIANMSYGQKKMTQLDSVSYAMGINLAEAWKKQGISQLNIDLLTKALNDVMQNKELLINKEDGNKVFGEYAKLVKEKQVDLSKLEGKAYREKNATKAGVKTLPNGLQYEVLTQGPGGPKPTPTDKVKVHYHGTLIDGVIFDSSVKRNSPATFGLNQVIKGWTEGLQLMSVGDKFRFVIPSELAYGERGSGALVGPGATLVFEVELLSIN
jgi:FKBP-type peptidyl-prolyl cis-trans isomerase FklB